MSLVPTLLEPKVGMENSLPFSRIAPGVIRSRRNACANDCLFAAIRSPEIFCPDASLPENVKTGMFSFSSLRYPFRSHRFVITMLGQMLKAPNRYCFLSASMEQLLEPESFPPSWDGSSDWLRG